MVETDSTDLGSSILLVVVVGTVAYATANNAGVIDWMTVNKIRIVVAPIIGVVRVWMVVPYELSQFFFFFFLISL